MATSRESLRADGECIYRLQPLGYPPEGATLTADEALAYPAAQLFVERLLANGVVNRISSDDVPAVSEICRRLDGIALALELAASQADTYGIQGIAKLLDTQMTLHLRGRRNAIPRQQTLSATLDWSYRLLSEDERSILRRLSIFKGSFSLEAGHSVASARASDPIVATAHVLAALVAKSLVSPHIFDGEMCYRLLDTTRSYLRGILDEEEAHRTARQHAIFYSDRMEVLHTILASEPAARRRFVYACHLADVRAALEWGFSSPSNATTAVELTVKAARLFIDLSLLTECRFWIDKAMPCTSLIRAPIEMELLSLLGITITLTEGNTPEARRAFDRSLALADSLGDLPFQLRVLSSLQLFLDRRGCYQEALCIAMRANKIAQSLADPASMAAATWTLATAQHLVGDQASAYGGCLKARRSSSSMRGVSGIRYGFDSQARAMGTTARVLWLCGLPEQALIAADSAVAYGEGLDHPVSLSVALMLAGGVYFWLEDFQRTEQVAQRLMALSEAHSLGPFQAFGIGLRGALSAKRGDLHAGIDALQASLASLQLGKQEVFAAAMKCALAESLTLSGRSEEALEMIDECVDRDEAGGFSWYSPELQRVQAIVRASFHDPAFGAVESGLRASIALAQKQSALGWELRSAYTLAKLIRHETNYQKALDDLEDVYARFTEGYHTSDLVKVETLLKAEHRHPIKRTDATAGNDETDLSFGETPK